MVAQLPMAEWILLVGLVWNGFERVCECLGI